VAAICAIPTNTVTLLIGTEQINWSCKTMTTSFKSQDQHEIWQVLREITDSWVQGRPDDLEKHFHADVVFVAPGFGQRLEGRAACVDSFRDFCSTAVVHNYTTTGPSLDVVAETAIAAYAFEIEYGLGSESFSEAGRDVWVFVRDQDRWLAVWRTIISASK
jgi:hypothetical protein